MRYVWIIYSRHFDFDIKNQIRKLNCQVLDEIIPNLMTNIEQYYGYIEDITKTRKLNPLPLNTAINRGTIELPSYKF